MSADGHGVVSHAGVGMLRELADLTGLSSQVSAALADTYKGPWVHAPGDVFAGLAAAVADGADCVDGVGQLWGDREHVFGVVASTTTLWRLVDERIDALHLPAIRAARAHARQQAWAAGAAPDHDGWLHLDVDATITIDGTVNLSNPRAIFAGSPPRFTRSRVTYEAYVVSRMSTRPQVDSALVGDVSAALKRRGGQLFDAVMVDGVEAGGRWSCIDNCGVAGVLDDPATSVMAAAAVVDGRRMFGTRDELKASVAVDADRVARVGADLKVFFSVVGKQPEGIRDADVLVFIQTQRQPRRRPRLTYAPKSVASTKDSNSGCRYRLRGRGAAQRCLERTHWGMDVAAWGATVVGLPWKRGCLHRQRVCGGGETNSSVIQTRTMVTLAAPSRASKSSSWVTTGRARDVAMAAIQRSLIRTLWPVSAR